MDTLLIDLEGWDLCVDANRHIALASNPYALAQGACCAMKSFLAENYYNTDAGVPYLQELLGFGAPLSLVKLDLIAAAITVPEVVSAQMFITAFGADEVLNGQVQVTDKNGTVTAANL